MKTCKFFRFPIRGVHSLHGVEPLHGHLAFLAVGLKAPVSEALEKEFLCFIKEQILSDFDKQDWSKSLSSAEPSGENVLLEIARRLKTNHFDIHSVHLQETKKNSFVVHS